jgi:hypothetical protein
MFDRAHGNGAGAGGCSYEGGSDGEAPKIYMKMEKQTQAF